MRHVWTLIVAVFIAPLAWLLLAFGQDRSLQAFADQGAAGGLSAGDFVRPTLCLAAAGLLFGLIATLRFSPLGAVLAGLAYAGSYVALLFDPDRVWDLLPKSATIASHHADLTTPVRTGATLLLGALLLVAVVSRDRWRRWPKPEPVASEPVDDSIPLPPADFDLTPLRKDESELAWANRHSGSTPPSDWPLTR
ncbi:hypothetical protein AB0J82_36365 [Asanoa sp. NPDC049518]|uniref:hypothetical protein n=1 Tax=unclassified Asanoa TaxID=2685164 RepID=UPI003412E0B1